MSKAVIIKYEELCTVAGDHAVFSWVTPDRRADTTVYIGEEPERLERHTFIPESEYHLAEIAGLRPETRYWYQVASGDARGSLNSFTTLPEMRGRHLFNLGLFSDIHVAGGQPAGDINEMFLGKLVENAEELFSQCVKDAGQRGIDLAVLAGDLTDTATRPQYLALRDRLLPGFGAVPYLLCPGNHDKYTGGDRIGEQGFIEYLSGRKRLYGRVVFGEHLLVFLDSARPNDNWGFIDDEQLRWLEDTLSENRGRPALIFLHHPVNGLDVWFGVKNHKAFRKVVKGFPAVRGVFCGHMHRQRMTYNRVAYGSLPYVQAPATVQFPCGYAVVRVYGDGFEYSAYKTSRLDLSELSRERSALKIGGKAVMARYALGGIGDRSFVWRTGRLHRPVQYELAVSLSQDMAEKLFEQAQSHAGASLAHAAEAGRSRVVLGRYNSLALAARARLQLLHRLGVDARIAREGGYDLPGEVKQNIIRSTGRYI